MKSKRAARTNVEDQTRQAVLIENRHGRSREVRSCRVPLGTAEQMIKRAARELVPDLQPLNFHLCIGFHDVRFALSVRFGRDKAGVATEIELFLKNEDRVGLLVHLAKFSHGLVMLSGDFPESYDDDDGDGGEELPVPVVGAIEVELATLDVPATRH